MKTAFVSIGRSLRGFGNWAGKFPSMAFGAAYLAAIPVFAAIYTCVPYDLYTSTAQYEPFVIRQTDEIAARLRDTFLHERPMLNGVVVTEPADDHVFPIFTIEPDKDHIQILVWMIVNANAAHVSDPVTKFALEMDRFSALEGYGQNGDDTNFEVSVHVRPQILSSDTIDLPLLFPCTHSAMRQGEPRSTCLDMTLRDYSALLSLSLTAQGHPTRLQGSYLRMLYFSTVTMSTLGYGDIVPVTTRSRAIVTVQVILGPILIGLFLNALASQRGNMVRQNRDNSDSTN